MHKYVFLDIDDVLLPWDFYNLDALKAKTGFHDWKKVPYKHMQYVSQDMLNSITDNFGNYIHWLTTWELSPYGANKNFCKKLGLPNFKTIPFIKDKFKTDYFLDPNSDYWWKSSTLRDFLISLPHTDWKGVWIDNDIAHEGHHIHDLLIDHPQLKLISPDPAITINQIAEAKEWLEE